MYQTLGISNDVVRLIDEAEKECQEEFQKIEKDCYFNSLKVLSSFHKNEITESHFNATTGYGYNDLGRDGIEAVFRDVLGAESALVRSQFISGSHALNVCFFALLRPGDLLLSISGKPYDTLDEVIGIKDNPSSLKSFGIEYDQIDLVNDDFDYNKIKEYLESHKVKVIEIQRSRGYSSRKSISLDKVEKIIQEIKKISPNTIVMIDNCYCEFVTTKEPCEVGADIVVGSLIKNLGGGMALNGGYVVGKKEYVHLVSEALTLPGEGKEVGPSLGANRQFLEGIFLAPQVVSSAVKTSILTSALLEELGYLVDPKPLEERVDIVLTILFGNPDDLISYCAGIQAGSPIDSFVKPIPIETPGYDDKVIMAAGAFVQGSSIELSCDGPLREPYLAYQQGGLTFESAKIGILKAVNEIIKKRKGSDHD